MSMGVCGKQLSDDDAACLTAVVKRHSSDPTEHELSVLRLVDTLTLADSEARACDLIGVPMDGIYDSD